MNRDRLLEQVKAQTFIGKDAAFLGCLLCNLTFHWDFSVKTAAVTKTDFFWNPDWFDSLSPSDRQFVLLHELWHIALLHSAREGSRDHTKWNIACDIRINNNLVADGYSPADGALLDNKYMNPKFSEEDIYNNLPDGLHFSSWGTFLKPNTEEQTVVQISMVQQAVSTSVLAGSVPGDVSKLLKEFLKPKLPWKQLLHRYLIEKLEPEWNWKHPNRRRRDVYLPSFSPKDNGLTSIVMALDTSGSISEEETKRFISEVKFVQNNLAPEKLIIIQFDTHIQSIEVYTPNKPFKTIQIKGYGGTSYRELRKYIQENKPKLTIIFTDLYASPMQPIKDKVLWVISSNKKPLFGDFIHVD